MSNLELNKRVAEKLGLRVHENIRTDSDAIWVSENNMPPYPVDFVNCWKDCGPLIERFNIRTEPTNGTIGWTAVTGYNSKERTTKARTLPYAICRVILMP